MHCGLTLTWDVLKCKAKNYDTGEYVGLTLTWDVLKSGFHGIIRIILAD